MQIMSVYMRFKSAQQMKMLIQYKWRLKYFNSHLIVEFMFNVLLFFHFDEIYMATDCRCLYWNLLFVSFFVIELIVKK